VLKQHRDVREAVVVARDDAAGQKRLVGYVVPTRDRAPTLAGKRRYKLPNGIAITQLNKNETDYLYEEIFERQAYLKHGITIKDGDCIFDVGANIGLFTLFADQISKNLKVFAFEPNPAVFEILSANASLCEADVKLFNCGLSDGAKTASFTFFPGFSLLSGFYADAQKEKEVVKTYMINQQKAGLAEMGKLLKEAEEILEERFTPRTFTTQLKSLSAVIEVQAIKSIDLLKINVEKSELDVLNGIKDADWSKIEQIVLEVDVKENLDVVVSLLQGHGYEVVVERDVLLQDTELCYVYAIRASEERKLIAKQEDGAHLLSLDVCNDRPLASDELRLFAREKLPDYMIPSGFVFLDALPLTPNGKIDRRALPPPDSLEPDLQDRYLAPRTATEKRVAEIWAGVLHVKQVGIHDNFFELGGHSLLAIQLVSRIRDAFQIELPLRSLFEGPTVAILADRVETILWTTESCGAVSGDTEEFSL
jgi:FkbM family methyltransferase